MSLKISLICSKFNKFEKILSDSKIFSQCEFLGVFATLIKFVVKNINVFQIWGHMYLFFTDHDVTLASTTNSPQSVIYRRHDPSITITQLP